MRSVQLMTLAGWPKRNVLSFKERSVRHLEDILNDAGIEEPLLHNGRWYVTKDAALAGMTAMIEECAKTCEEMGPHEFEWAAARLRDLLK